MSRERTPRTGCCQFLASSLCFQKLRATGGFEFFFTILTIDGTIQKSGEQFRGRCHKVRKPLRCNGFEPASFLSTRHIGRLAICKSAFLCGDIHKGVFIPALLLTLGSHRLKILKGDVKLDFQRVVPININGFDKLGYNHLFLVECASVV